MTLSDGSTPIVDALNELKNYITAEQASVKGKCEKIIIQAENRQREEIQSFRKLFSNRRSFLDEKIREREMKISAWQEEIRKIDLLDLIPAHAIASRISYATKIEKYIEDNQKDYQEIQQLGIIGDTLGQEVIKV